jgi:hypothetical protein
LNGDLDLDPVLVVTGNAAQTWATSCGEYVEYSWPEGTFGQKALIGIERLLGSVFRTEGESSVEMSNSEFAF